MHHMLREIYSATLVRQLKIEIRTVILNILIKKHKISKRYSYRYRSKKYAKTKQTKKCSNLLYPDISCKKQTKIKSKKLRKVIWKPKYEKRLPFLFKIKK